MMTEAMVAPGDAAVPAAAGTMLVSLGLQAGTEAGAEAAGLGGMAPLGQQLADLLAAPLLALGNLDDPDTALTALAKEVVQHPQGWLAVLERDIGVPLADGRCWAEVLGAWRQPALLVIPAGQLASGVPAAAAALLRHWRVPLVGLLQWGGVWQAESRRRDGLPWLGQLASAGELVSAEELHGLADPDGVNGEGPAALSAALKLRHLSLLTA